MLKPNKSRFQKNLTPIIKRQSEFRSYPSDIYKLHPLRVIEALKNIAKLQNGRKLGEKGGRSQDYNQSKITKSKNTKNNNVYSSKTPPIYKNYETADQRSSIIKKRTNVKQQSEFVSDEEQIQEQFPIKPKNSSRISRPLYEIDNKKSKKWDMNGYDRAITEGKLSIEQKSVNISNKQKMQAKLFYDKTEPSEVMINLIDKFKFENLKLEPNSSNNTCVIAENKYEIVVPQLEMSKKLNPSFFRHPYRSVEKKLLNVCNKSIDSNFSECRGKKQPKSTAVTEVKNGMKVSGPVLSPWLTLSDQFMTHLLIDQ